MNICFVIGFQAQSFCVCTDDFNHTPLNDIDDASCSMTCAGNHNQKCGNTNYYSVYRGQYYSFLFRNVWNMTKSSTQQSYLFQTQYHYDWQH